MVKIAYICLTLLALGIINSQTGNVWASCMGPLTMEQYRDSADFVVLGQASASSGTYSTFAVEKYYKGTGPAALKVTGRASDTGAVTSVDFDIATGKKYLLFLEGDVSSVLKTNSCSGSREVAGFLGAEEVNALGEGKTPVYGSETKNNQIALGLSALVVLLILLKARGKVFA